MFIFRIVRRKNRTCRAELSSEVDFWGCCVCGHGGFFVLLGGPARRDGETSAARLQEKAKQGLSFERWFVCPAGTAAFLLFSLGRLRGGRQMGASGGCQTQSFWRGPLCTPPGRPRWACRIPPLPRAGRQGLSKRHNSARAARPLLRELPRCARDLPPRRAMPSVSLALVRYVRVLWLRCV